MIGPNVHRLVAGTIGFRMRMHQPRWSYDDEIVGRVVDVEVEIIALDRMGWLQDEDQPCRVTLVGKRPLVEFVARRIIDREGPYFTEPVRVTATDLRF